MKRQIVSREDARLCRKLSVDEQSQLNKSKKKISLIKDNNHKTRALLVQKYNRSIAVQKRD